MLYREGVCHSCPEGKSWIHVDVPSDLYLVQLSVGPSGLLWAITYDGEAVVRLGISHQNPLGKFTISFLCCLSFIPGILTIVSYVFI